jgi:hypothetical protein
MNRTKYFPALILFAGVLLLIAACTPGACFDETNAYLKASLWKLSTNKNSAPDSLSAWGAGKSERIYNSEKSLTLAKLPLNDASVGCTIVLKINDVNDTISLWYSTYPHLISKECGYTFYHDLDSVKTTNHLITRIDIKNKNVNTTGAENIRIYY